MVTDEAGEKLLAIRPGKLTHFFGHLFQSYGHNREGNLRPPAMTGNQMFYSHKRLLPAGWLWFKLPP
jgi:hypothetical protein